MLNNLGICTNICPDCTFTPVKRTRLLTPSISRSGQLSTFIASCSKSGVIMKRLFWVNARSFKKMGGSRSAQRNKEAKWWKLKLSPKWSLHYAMSNELGGGEGGKKGGGVSNSTWLLLASFEITMGDSQTQIAHPIGEGTEGPRWASRRSVSEPRGPSIVGRPKRPSQPQGIHIRNLSFFL